MKPLGGGWDELLAPLFNDEKYKKIREFLKYEYSNYTVYPDMYDLYNCFRYTPLNDIKAVILGQDPYHEPNQAHGLCFDEVGERGRSFTEHYSHRARTSCQLSLQMRLGLVHRQRDKTYIRQYAKHGIYSLGRKREEQNSAHR